MKKFGQSRVSGILLHPTSLPSPYGIGDLGQSAYDFVDFLVHGGQSLWQILPLGPTGYGDSPYQCLSAFAGNPLLISPDKLVEEGFLDRSDLEPLPKFPAEGLDFCKVIDYKNLLLEKAFEKFKATTITDLRSDFLRFTHKMASWLDDYALYRALKDVYNGSVWNTWPNSQAQREKGALVSAREGLHDKIEAHKFRQYLFFKQWD